MKYEGATVFKKCGVTVQTPANKTFGTVVETRARFADQPPHPPHPFGVSMVILDVILNLACFVMLVHGSALALATR